MDISLSLNRFCFVDYSNIPDASEALEKLTGTKIDGQEISVCFGRPRRSDDDEVKPSSTVVVKNLSFDTDADELKSNFEGCTDVRLPTDRNTGRPKG